MSEKRKHTVGRPIAEQEQNEQQDEPVGNTVKDPDEWTTGDEPMTGAQRSYLKTLSDEAKEPMEENLTKTQASKRIEKLQRKTGRGLAPGEQRSASEEKAEPRSRG